MSVRILWEITPYLELDHYSSDEFQNIFKIYFGDHKFTNLAHHKKGNKIILNIKKFHDFDTLDMIISKERYKNVVKIDEAFLLDMAIAKTKVLIQNYFKKDGIKINLEKKNDIVNDFLNFYNFKQIAYSKKDYLIKKFFEFQSVTNIKN